jgi:hypothetical protein
MRISSIQQVVVDEIVATYDNSSQGRIQKVFGCICPDLSFQLRHRGLLEIFYLRAHANPTHLRQHTLGSERYYSCAIESLNLEYRIIEPIVKLKE